MKHLYLCTTLFASSVHLEKTDSRRSVELDGYEREWDLDCDLLREVSEKLGRETLEARVVK